MNLKAILTIAALGVSLSAVHAYADGDGGEGDGDPFPYRAPVQVVRLEPDPPATRADTAPASALAPTAVVMAPSIAVTTPSRTVAARHTPAIDHRTHTALSKSVTHGYDEPDVLPADIRRIGR